LREKLIFLAQRLVETAAARDCHTIEINPLARLKDGELIALDALERRESCGGHFREEYQTPDNEALRDDEAFTHVAAWEYAGDGALPIRNIEPLAFESVKPSQRSYK